MLDQVEKNTRRARAQAEQQLRDLAVLDAAGTGTEADAAALAKAIKDAGDGAADEYKSLVRTHRRHSELKRAAAGLARLHDRVRASQQECDEHGRETLAIKSQRGEQMRDLADKLQEASRQADIVQVAARDLATFEKVNASELRASA